jgi:hypothetical protein
MLCEYFTKLIFKAVDTDLEDDIPFGVIKDAIVNGNTQSRLLTMFCGADI